MYTCHALEATLSGFLKDSSVSNLGYLVGRHWKKLNETQVLSCPKKNREPWMEILSCHKSLYKCFQCSSLMENLQEQQSGFLSVYREKFFQFIIWQLSIYWKSDIAFPSVRL